MNSMEFPCVHPIKSMELLSLPAPTNNVEDLFPHPLAFFLLLLLDFNSFEMTKGRSSMKMSLPSPWYNGQQIAWKSRGRRKPRNRVSLTLHEAPKEEFPPSLNMVRKQPRHQPKTARRRCPSWTKGMDLVSSYISLHPPPFPVLLEEYCLIRWMF